MSKVTQEDINKAVIIKDGEALTSSLSVAYVFGKRHIDVMNAIKKVRRRCVKIFTHPLGIKFFESFYINPQNHQKYKKFLMNYHAFFHVAMSFDGDKAFEFKEMFYQSFKNMQYQLRNIKPPMNKLKDRDQELLQNKVDTLGPKLHQQKHLNWYEEQTVKALKPASDAYHQEMASQNVFPLSDLAERYGTDATTMNLVLQKIDVVRKLGGKWYLTKDYLDRGYACHNLTSLTEGRNTSSLKWTNKGFNFIREMLKLHFNVTELHQMGNEFNNTFLLVRNNHKYEVRKLTAAQLGLAENWRNK